LNQKNKKMKYKVTNIEYDTDGEDVDLPEELTITVENSEELEHEEIVEYISDEISNQTGVCHNGFSIDPEI